MRKEVAREDIFHNVSNGGITIFVRSNGEKRNSVMIVDTGTGNNWSQKPY